MATYLQRTESAGNRKTFTWSAWVKLGNATATKFLAACSYSSSDGTVRTNRLFRDINGWYHIVLAVDTTQATDSNRIKFYVNGVQETSMSTATYPAQDRQLYWNVGGTYYPRIGKRHASGNEWDGSMSHVVHIDGTQELPTIFGETDSTTGEWKIKTSITPSSGWGTNGYHILKDGNSVTDQSGQGNNWSVGGGTLTKTEDNPSNVFATLNPLHMDDPTSQYFLSNGNLRQNVTNNDGHRETGFTLHPKGLKGYFEVKCTVDPNFHLGLQNVTSRLLNTNYYTLASPNYYYMQASNPVKISYANGGSAATHIADYFSQISVGDIIGCAFDFTGTNKNVWFHKNGTYGNNGSGVGNPATGAYPAMTSTQLTADEYEFIVSPNTGSGNGQLDFNFGNGYFGTTAVSSNSGNGYSATGSLGIFQYQPPTGYTALCTKGLNL